MRNLFKVAAMVMVIMLFFGGCQTQPIAKIHLKEELKFSGCGGTVSLWWVDLLEIYDKEAVKARASKVSEDWQRANLNVEPRWEKDKDGNWDKRYISKDRVYYWYPGSLSPHKRLELGWNLCCWVLFTIMIFFLACIVRPQKGEKDLEEVISTYKRWEDKIQKDINNAAEKLLKLIGLY